MSTTFLFVFGFGG